MHRLAVRKVISVVTERQPTDDSTTERAQLGAEARSGDGSSAVTERGTGPLLDVRRMAAIPASNDVVDGALRLVVALAAATVGGADGVSVSLERHGQLMTVASSDQTILQMDHDQYATGQGPCVAAATEGHWFHVESLADETRWPEFVPRAIKEGIHSILSTPLLAASRPVGALNIYSNSNRAFGPSEQELAALFATQASRIIEDAGINLPTKEVAAQLDLALRTRELIAQAQGVLMSRDHISADDAAAHLRRTARAADLPLRQVAARIVKSTELDNRSGALRESDD